MSSCYIMCLLCYKGSTPSGGSCYIMYLLCYRGATACAGLPRSDGARSLWLHGHYRTVHLPHHVSPGQAPVPGPQQVLQAACHQHQVTHLIHLNYCRSKYCSCSNISLGLSSFFDTNCYRSSKFDYFYVCNKARSSQKWLSSLTTYNFSHENSVFAVLSLIHDLLIHV